jgi:prepilin-type N-terminal cleavage/methylation domain-containing protein
MRGLGRSVPSVGMARRPRQWIPMDSGENQMKCRKRPSAAPRNPAHQGGFTIVELAVVMVVLTIITSIGLANFMKFRTRASYTSCVSNQRHILEASTLYISAMSPGTVDVDVSTLTGGGYVAPKIAGCPTSTVHALDDYVIHIDNNAVSAIDCKIKPAEHQWNIP